jgi:hypothetical protein
MITKLIPVWRTWTLLGLVLVMLSGCTVKFFYNQLDWLTGWYLSDYVSLTPEQTPMFDARLKSILQWHRQTALPEYAVFFERIIVAKDDGLSVPELMTLQTEFEGFVDALLHKSSDSLAEVLMQMTDAQVAELQASFDKANQEYFDEFVAVAEVKQRQARAKKMQAFIERFSGDLTTEQQAQVVAWSQRYQLMGSEFLAARRAWQKEFMALLHARNIQPDDQPAVQRLSDSSPAFSEVFSAKLSQVLLNRKAHHSPAYQAKFVNNQALLFGLFSELTAYFTEAQKQTMTDKLNELAADFRALSRQ